MKTEFTQAMEAVRECGDFIVCEQRGIFRVFLEDLGFRVWTSTGNPEEQLQEIACLDSCSSEECGPVIYPRPVEGEEDGVYSVNLIELMHQGVPLISREILIPFFETTSFTRLEITCDHLPRWFEFELPQLSLRLESTKKISGSSDIVAVVVPEVGERTCPRGRTRRSCGCSCGG